MLEGLARHADVRAVVPVPWPESLHGPQAVPTTYDLTPARFYYVPMLDRLALSDRMHVSLSRLLARQPVPDLILGYWVDPDGTAALTWGRRIGRPVVQIVGGSDVLLLTEDARRRARITETLRGAALVLAIGNGVRDAIENLGIPVDRVEVISRGVDRSQFHILPARESRQKLGLPAERKLLLWVGRMVAVKGLDVLFRAMADPAVARTDLAVVLVGDGPLKGALGRLARRLGIEDRVIFAGRVSHAELPTWYAAADRLVLPSRSEGVPNVLLEGLACGRRFFASRVGGVPDLATDPDQLLPVGDVAAWATRLAAWASAPREEALEVEIPDHLEAATRLFDLLKRVT